MVICQWVCVIGIKRANSFNFSVQIYLFFVISMIVQNITSACVIIEVSFKHKRNGVHRTMKAA